MSQVIKMLALDVHSLLLFLFFLFLFFLFSFLRSARWHHLQPSISKRVHSSSPQIVCWNIILYKVFCCQGRQVFYHRTCSVQLLGCLRTFTIILFLGRSSGVSCSEKKRQTCDGEKTTEKQSEGRRKKQDRWRHIRKQNGGYLEAKVG